MPWKAFKRLLEMQGISLGFEDSTKLHRIIKFKGDQDMVMYKEALSYISPNFDQDDPIRSVWVLRKNGPQQDNLSKFGSRKSFSIASRSPSKLSMRSLNNPVQAVIRNFAPPIKKLKPEKLSPRQTS